MCQHLANTVQRK